MNPTRWQLIFIFHTATAQFLSSIKNPSVVIHPPAPATASHCAKSANQSGKTLAESSQSAINSVVL